MTPITLRNGKVVEIIAFHCQSIGAYLSEAGVLEGSVRGMNRFVRQNAGSALADTWKTQRATLLMPRWLDTNVQLVPSYLLHAWLRGDDTDLVVAFFRDLIDKPVETMVREAAYDLDWPAGTITV